LDDPGPACQTLWKVRERAFLLTSEGNMTKYDLIHVECSSRKLRSHSKAVAEKFIEAYLQAHPGHKVKTIDIWSVELPEYDEFAANSKYKIFSGEAYGPEERERWDHIAALFNEFNEGRKYIFSVPMWNFSIPYKLKHYIDIITQPTLAFNATENGYEGLVSGRPVAVIYASGGSYDSEPFQAYDQQRPYMEQWLQFIGFRDIQSISVAPMLREQAARVKGIEEAMKRASGMAVGF